MHNMPNPLNILIVEDSPDDADLVLRELRRAGFEPKWKRVETEGDFLAELKKGPDIILSDYSMPQFSGLRAAELLRKSGLPIPFILISGTVGEEVAVEAMQYGATDYLLKDRIGRLGQAVERALRESKEQEKLKRAQAELRQSEHRFREMLDNLKLIAMTLDKKGNITFCNDYLLQLTGWKSGELIGANWFEKFIPDTNTALKKMFFETIETGIIPPHHENSIKTKSGELREIVWNNTMLRDTSGNNVGTASIGEDITDRKRAQENLIEKTAFLEAQTNSTMDAILVVNDHGKIILRNQRLIQMFQIPDELAGDDDDAKALAYVINQIKDPEQFNRRVQYLYEHPEEIGRDEIAMVDGKILDRYSSPVRDKAGKYYGRIWTFRDITDQRRLEEQFRQSQKMEAIGQLAGGVSHDFNNILGVIEMQAYLLKATGGLSSEQKEFADEIAAAAERAAALTRQLLLFSRKETMRLQDLDLNDSINNMAKMLRRTLGENVQIIFKFAMQPLHVHADPNMIDQVLMNLAVNSRDAMPQGGKLVIETSAVEFDEHASSQSIQTRPGSFVCLSVSDTGCGISPENLARIFEPFFTTKGVGKGTGLGLATVFGIIQQHQGWINVYSEVGRGTTFRIYLPRLARKSEQKSDEPSAVPLPGGNETILLVEDDPFLRASVRKILLQLGYRILEAVSGVEALETWEQHKGEIRLLLTDLVMPGGLTGIDLGGQLLKDKPALKVVYVSGYATEVAGKDFQLEEGVNFVTKPFSAPKLAQTIRARLDS